MSAPLSELKNEFSLYIDRRTRELSVLTKEGRVLLIEKIGIGRGGLKRKTTMSDYVTPTGRFHVDIILCEDERFNAIDSTYAMKCRSAPQYQCLVDSPAGLTVLFSNMNSIDFDNDGMSDRAYGSAYLGLTSSVQYNRPKDAHVSRRRVLVLYRTSRNKR